MHQFCDNDNNPPFPNEESGATDKNERRLTTNDAAGDGSELRIAKNGAASHENERQIAKNGAARHEKEHRIAKNGVAGHENERRIATSEVAIDENECLLTNIDKMTENPNKESRYPSVNDDPIEDPQVCIKYDAVEGNGQSAAIVKDGDLTKDYHRANEGKSSDDVNENMLAGEASDEYWRAKNAGIAGDDDDDDDESMRILNNNDHDKDDDVGQVLPLLKNKNDATYGRKCQNDDANLKKRTLATNANEKKFFCNQWEKSFSSQSNLYTHLQSNHGAISHEPGGMNFINRTHLLTHNEVLHQNSFSCEPCGMTFINRTNLLTHNEVLHQNSFFHWSVNENSFTCENCGKSFLTKWALKRHMNQSHSKERKSFHPCGKSFSIKGNLNKHISHYHSKEGNSLHPCEKCGHSFLTKGNLTKHISLNHKYPCENCGKSFLTKSFLNNHIRLFHSKERKPFSREHALKTWIIKFDEERPYIAHISKGKIEPFTCLLCGKRFVSKSNLARHVKKLHKSVKWECYFCDRSFPGQKMLCIHEKAEHYRET